ncbi:hypothetical protein [Pseudomonas citrulli]|uniref:Lipoprotein n=1 Tax=Pseudomonas citrulli TaxID=3064347 RepID=A0ABT9BUY3_9PSED|nr:hypothetical protein [Pseudomonas sp. K18]MDO7896006.1 hypothetical protein [Pseudomonas sp. K18]
MKRPTCVSLAFIMLAIVAGCAPYKNSRTLEAEDRLLLYTEMTKGTGAEKVKTDVMCPEPSPDALKTLAASMSVEKQDVAALAAAYSEGGANIGLRTHSIQLLRDQLFSICQAYANGALSKPAYQMLLTRNQRNTVALMAVEQLTGVLRTPSVTLSGASSVGPNNDLIKAVEKLKEGAEKDFNALSAEDKKKAEEAYKAKIAAYDKQIKDAKDQIVAAAVSTESKPGSNGGIDSASVGAVVTAVQHITDQVNDVNDLFYICLEVIQTAPANGAQIPAALKDTCDQVFQQAKDRGVKGGAGVGANS